GDHDTGREALHVPLPRTDVRLIKIIEIERKRALRRRKGPEVVQMSIPANVRVQSERGRRGEVVGHDYRRAAKERRWVSEHPAVPDGDKTRQAAAVGTAQHGDWIG